MTNPEDILPRDLQFDSALEESQDEIVESLHEILDATGDVLDPAAELSRKSELLGEPSVNLAFALHAEGEDLHQVSTALYRGMYFALQIVDRIKSGPITRIALSELVDCTQPDEELAEDLRLITSKYLSNRQHVDNLIFKFMVAIDQTDVCNHHAETGAAMMFMLAERHQAEDYIDETAAALTPEQFM